MATDASTLGGRSVTGEGRGSAERARHRRHGCDVASRGLLGHRRASSALRRLAPPSARHPRLYRHDPTVKSIRATCPLRTDFLLRIKKGQESQEQGELIHKNLTLVLGNLGKLSEVHGKMLAELFPTKSKI